MILKYMNQSCKELNMSNDFFFIIMMPERTLGTVLKLQQLKRCTLHPTPCYPFLSKAQNVY